MTSRQTTLRYWPLRAILVTAVFLFSTACGELEHGGLSEVNPLPEVTDAAPTAIEGARLIDGLGGDPVDNAIVIVEGSRISAAGPAGEIEIPSDALRVDASGMSLLPGLIDAHFHSIMNNSLLHRFLQNGVTTLREPGHPFRFYQNIHFAEAPLPRIFLTGAHLDGYPPVWSQQAVVVRNEDHARQTVFNHVSKGATGIKLYFRLPLDYYETVTQTASEAGIPVIAHLELVDADDAILAGVEGIEHVTSFGTALADPSVADAYRDSILADYGYRGSGRFRLWSQLDLDHDRAEEVIRVALDHGAVLSPTLAIFEWRENEEGAETFHAEAFHNMLRFTGMAHEAGIPVVTGSHTHVRYADTGWGYQREMELLLEAGLSPMDVIVASTLANARFLRSEERIGSIEPGKLADLILVGGNPLDDISAMYDIERVMLNGQWIDRE